jgi:hypothetical protein
MKQTELNEYFSTKWQSNLNQYTYSGWALADKIHTNELVLDVGCGFNEFKSRIPNLIGIDPTIKKFWKKYKNNIVKIPDFFSKESIEKKTKQKAVKKKTNKKRREDNP